MQSIRDETELTVLSLHVYFRQLQQSIQLTWSEILWLIRENCETRKSYYQFPNTERKTLEGQKTWD